jgi:hypothetical protein
VKQQQKRKEISEKPEIHLFCQLKLFNKPFTEN